MKKIMGVFKYDCFPGMVVHEIIGWDDNGNIQMPGGWSLEAFALITVFPKKQGMAIQQRLQKMKQIQCMEAEKVQKELMEHFFEDYPTLSKKG